jgi:hypothetical protein
MLTIATGPRLTVCQKKIILSMLIEASELCLALFAVVLFMYVSSFFFRGKIKSKKKENL